MSDVGAMLQRMILFVKQDQLSVRGEARGLPRFLRGIGVKQRTDFLSRFFVYLCFSLMVDPHNFRYLAEWSDSNLPPVRTFVLHSMDGLQLYIV